MDKVNRYSCSEQWHGMSPDDDGDFVRHADYAALQARIAELEARADVSWQTWPEVRRAFCALMTDLSLRLKSGNSVPVERTHLTAAEFAVIEQHALACEDISWKQYDAMSEVRERAEAAEARNAASERDAWIAVSDRLPAEHGYVLVHMTTGLITSTFFTTLPEYFHFEPHAVNAVSNCFEQAARYGYEVSHWKPHPAPPSTIDAHAQGQAGEGKDG